MQELNARGHAARLPRPLRRRPVRDAARDGVRRRRGPGRSTSARAGAADADRGALFTEELGAVLRCARRTLARVRAGARRRGPGRAGARASAAPPRERPHRDRRARRRALLDGARASRCAASGRRPRYRMQALRDDPSLRRRGAGRARRRRAIRACSRGRHVRRSTTTSPRRSSRGGARPRVAILREQGVNGQIEMAAAFDRAGFEAVDVHMSDLLDGRASTWRDFRGLVGLRRLLLRRRARRGRGLGQVHPVQRARARRVRRASSRARTRFALGVCNGCQMMSQPEAS